MSRQARNNCSVNMMIGRLVNKDKQYKKCVSYQSIKNGMYQTISQLSEVEHRTTYLTLHIKKPFIEAVDQLSVLLLL
ncbi:MULTISPECIES: hypothetical protein [Vagococcus]|uniref:hypothetical protein n=1 Tax=Vagococcus TaxID=2737 RepID=UPI0011C34D75|nr:MULTISPECIES: hypothetical protein [Vagococcus]